MSWRRWQGWEPAEHTTYEYDDQGRLIASTTVREAEWDAKSRGWAVGLVELEKQECGTCGGWLPETTDPAMEESFRAQQPVRCWKCHWHYDAMDLIHATDANGQTKYPEPRALMVPMKKLPPRKD